jgi:hypothetical protein
MKIFFNGYPNYWLSPYTILEKIIFWREIDYDEPVIDKWANRLTPFCEALQKVRKIIHPKIRYVKIDRYDTWNMDNSLAHIIHPMLIQLRDTKHGSPNVDDNDVPKNLRRYVATQPIENDTDEFWHDRWTYVLNEMIFAFEQELKDDDEAEFFDFTKSKGNIFEGDYVGPEVDWDGLKAHQERKANGFRLFGTYYSALWD